MSAVEDGPWEDPAKFQDWIENTTGWDGKTFSLTEDERFWISRANEVIEWLKTYAVSKSPEALDAALRSLANLPRIPGSLT